MELLTCYDDLKREGNRLSNDDRHHEAIECFDKALEIKPRDADVLIMKGDAFFMSAKYAESIRCFEDVIDVNPDNAVALNSKGFVLHTFGLHQDALEYYDRALAVEPDKYLTLLNKGDLLYETGNYRDAILCYARILASCPNDGSALFGQKRTSEKIHMQKCSDDSHDRTNKPDPATISNDRGRSMYKLGKYQEALQCHDDALATDPDNVVALKGKIKSLEKLIENWKA